MEREQEVKNQSEDLKQNAKGDYLITDESGKKHLIKADIANKWLEAFNLKSLDESFVPNFSDEVKELLAQNGVNEIKLKVGSLLKLDRNNRMQYLDRIKPTLQEPNAILKQNDGALIFVKDFNDKKFFTSIARDTNGEWIITSNAPKSLNNVKNKLKQGGKLLYNDLKELETIKINANDFTQEANSPKQQAINNIIPQKNNQSQALDMNDDSALKAIKNEVSSIKESQVKDNTSSQDYQTEFSDNEKALFGSQAKNQQHKRQRR